MKQKFFGVINTVYFFTIYIYIYISIPFNIIHLLIYNNKKMKFDSEKSVTKLQRMGCNVSTVEYSYINIIILSKFKGYPIVTG